MSPGSRDRTLLSHKLKVGPLGTWGSQFRSLDLILCFKEWLYGDLTKYMGSARCYKSFISKKKVHGEMSAIAAMNSFKKKKRSFILTFANRGSVHYPYQRRTVLTVCRDAILGSLKDVTIVLFHLNAKT